MNVAMNAALKIANKAEQKPAPFVHTLRVRWAEVDLQKIVFNGNYLLYFDVAFTEFWRATGLPAPLAQQTAGFEMFAKKSMIEYHAPAHFDDILNITVRCGHLGNTSARFDLSIWRGEPEGKSADSTLIVTGEMVYVHVAVAEMKPTPWPEAWRAVLTM